MGSARSISCGIVAAPVTKADAQGFGSAMTYARRYGLSAAFGVAPEDDDGIYDLEVTEALGNVEPGSVFLERAPSRGRFT